MRPLLAAFLLAPWLTAQQGAWATIPGDPAPPRWSTGLMAFDRARSCMVFVNGSDVWESRGTAWQMAASIPNTGGTGGGFAFDENRQRCLWFGGQGFGSNALSEWNGTTWTPVTTANAPPPRANTAMAFDSLRSRMVLYGGWAGAARLNDTWEFDGVDWQQAFPTQSPPGMGNHRMTYDRARGDIVLYFTQNLQHGCWLYDGTTWRSTPVGPPALFTPALVYDEARARTVLSSSVGAFGSPLQISTWEWDGASWSNPLPNGPRLQFSVNGAYDSVRGAVQLVGSTGDGISTWRWTGSQWERGTPFGSLPSMPGIAAAYHAATGEAVAFGGTASVLSLGWPDDTYAYRRGGWRVLAPTSRPSARGHAAMASEPMGDLLLMGGSVSSTAFADTWRWNGVTWAQLTPAVSPPARSGHAMATDLARGRIVLFGGQDGLGTLFGDTWEWDGVVWNQRTPPNSPSPRVFSAMTYDLHRARTLLFGGGFRTSFNNELWQWDGATWTRRVPPVSPAPRGSASFTFDWQHGIAVLAGGSSYHFLGVYIAVPETWLWDGVQWTQVTTTAPEYDPNAVGVYHFDLGSTLYSSPAPFPTMRFASDHEFVFGSVAATSTFGSGCPGATGVPLLSAVSVPRAGNRRFAVWLCNAQAGAFSFVGFDWQTTTIPLGNGCQSLLPSAVIATTVADAFGNALVPFPVPANSALHGLMLHGQGVTLDPAGALFGIAAMTAGLRIVFS